MMKYVLILVLAAICLSKADDFLSRTADLTHLRLQSKFYELLFFVRQNDLIDASFYEIGKNYKIEEHRGDYDPIVWEEFLRLREGGFLSRDAIYSPMYEEHRKEVAMLFRLMYTAVNDTVFYNTACWARFYMNDAVFANAYYAAIFYRKDMEVFELMQPSEVYPNYFFDSKIIEQAKRYKMRGPSRCDQGYLDSYKIHTNYTKKFLEGNEIKLNYFMEDYDLNNFYFYFRGLFPSWISSKNYDLIPQDIRGVFYLYIHQQLMARYNLERYANGLEEVKDTDWKKVFYPGFYSSLEFPNGVVMPTRQNYHNLPGHKQRYVKEIDHLESRLMDIIDSGYVMHRNGTLVYIRNNEGLNILGNIIEGNDDSYNKEYYSMYEYKVRRILGYNNDYKNKHTIVPSSLDFYSTSMRDPGFYRILHRIINYVYRYKQYQPAYQRNDLMFPGVRISDVNMDKLETFFRYCSVKLNNAVFVRTLREGLALSIDTCQTCLDYTPFTYRFTVISDKETQAVVKIFLGPADDSMEIDYVYLQKYFKYFIVMDEFNVTLKQGDNKIERYSEDSVFTTSGMASSNIFYKKLQKSISGSEPFTYRMKRFGFPKRLTLPKGRKGGMKFKMFFFVYPSNKYQTTKYDLPYFESLMYNVKEYGFPLDRPKFIDNFITPNMRFEDVYIDHHEDFTNYEKCLL